MIRSTTTKLELSDKLQAVSCGGLAAIMELIKTVGLRKELNSSANVFKLHLPYDEADHLFNIAFNLLSGGTCLDHMEHRRNDEAYLDALGAERIPDPTTAGDFCRRFSQVKLMLVMQAINRVRQSVWKQQEDSFFDCATIEADRTMVETSGEKKAGFRKIVLRGDTDFSSTEHLDRWDKQGVKFILGFDARANLCHIAENLPETAWKRLDRPKQSCAPEKERTKRPNAKEPIVVANGYENQKLRAESYAEFDYRPIACGKYYRMVIVRKEIDVTSEQMFLFDKDKYFFYITNEDQGEVTGREVIRGANRRCNRENTISQLKACGALSVPLNDLESNGAYMLFASLAWTLKLWSGMMIRVTGNAIQK